MPVLERSDADAVLLGKDSEGGHQSPVDDPSFEIVRRLRRRPEVGVL